MSNEGKVCHAVITVLERRLRLPHAERTRPEAERHEAPIDYAFLIGEQQFALEHTVVEAFNDQLRFDRDFQEFLDPIEAEFSLPLPHHGTFYVSFPVNTRVGKAQLNEVRHAVVSWIKETASHFASAEPVRHSRDVKPRGVEQRAEVEIGGMRIILMRELHWSTSGRHDGLVLFSRHTPAGEKELEAQRVERIRQALQRKLPKLRHWQKGAAKSILVLENKDISLSNEVSISKATALCFNTGEFQGLEPDMIYLADCSTRDLWAVILIRDGGGPWLHEVYDKDFTEFRSEELVDLGA